MTMAGLWSYLKTTLVLQLLAGYVVIGSGLVVNFLQLCSCVLWPFSKDLYRKLNRELVELHWCMFTFLGHWWSESEVTLVVDEEDFKHIGHEHALVIMNHKYDVDWLMTWMVAQQKGLLGGTKIYGKDMLKYVPLIGWAWVFTESIFLKRNWDKDREIIIRDINKLTKFPYNVILLLFCEGTRFTPAKRDASNEVARNKGMPELKHHLLPRTKGFALSMQGLKGKFPVILDLTTGFRTDGAEPTFMSIVNGKKCKAEIYCRRILIDDVPMATEEQCSDWLHQLYREKDEIYDSFARNGTFDGNRIEARRTIKDLVIFLVWAVLLLTPLFYFLGRVVLAGSLFALITFLTFVIIGVMGTRKLITVTETASGSSYGTGPKLSSNNNKKVQ